MELLENALLNDILYSVAELMSNRQVKPAIHDAAAVGGAYHCVRRTLEEVALNDGNFLVVLERTLPGPRQSGAVVDQQKAFKQRRWGCHLDIVLCKPSNDTPSWLPSPSVEHATLIA